MTESLARPNFSLYTIDRIDEENDRVIQARREGEEDAQVGRHLVGIWQTSDPSLSREPVFLLVQPS